jgi:hypothetical protein
MRTYDPADSIRYVHLAPQPTARRPVSDARSSCSRLPTGYANQAPQVRLGGTPRSRAVQAAPEVVGPAPLLVVIPGGAEAGTDTDRTAALPALRLA